MLTAYQGGRVEVLTSTMVGAHDVDVLIVGTDAGPVSATVTETSGEPDAPPVGSNVPVGDRLTEEFWCALGR